MAGTEEGPPPEGALRGPAYQHHHLSTVTVISSNALISTDGSEVYSVSERASCNLRPNGHLLNISCMVQAGRH